MSRMIPQETVQALRQFNDTVVGLYGIDCTLYQLSNANAVEALGIYSKPSDSTFTEYTTTVFIEWSPSAKKLRKLGLFVEDEIPILAWFSNQFESVQRNVTDLDIVIGSYFKVDVQYIPDDYDTDEFEIIDVVIRAMHDALVLKCFKIAPRRVKAD